MSWLRKKPRHYGGFFLCLLLLPFFTQAQEKCATPHFAAISRPADYKPQQFEDWLQQKIASRARRGSDNTTLTIPVVVHIIHHGEAIGNVTNIPTAQVLSQIETLNEDFSRQNPDQDETLDQFKAVAADTHIQFQLATQDPEGLPTNGITRTYSSQSTFGPDDILKLSNLSYWPSEDYLNIWVADLPGDLLGFAQLPTSNLDGLIGQTINPRTDGVIIDYQYFGTGYNADNFSKGRTATHEIGHFLGLRHIWGDGGCDDDDFCADTPDASSASLGCNLQKATCNSLDMVQNYMDYTDDKCMNLFTQDQRARMRAILENSPRRKSLLTSHGLLPAQSVSLDAGIVNVTHAGFSPCDSTLSLEVEVKNYGQDSIKSVALQLFKNGAAVDTFSYAPQLATLQSQVFYLPAQALDTNQWNAFALHILKANGQTDTLTRNNDWQDGYFHPGTTRTSLTVNFSNGLPADWGLENPDDSLSWAYNASVGALQYAMDNYPHKLGERDVLYAPPVLLQNYQNPHLQLTYAKEAGNPVDGLQIDYSKDCGQHWTTIYRTNGVAWTTAYATPDVFVPNSPLDWKTLDIPLGLLALGNQALFRVVGVNGEGGRCYLQSLAITEHNALQQDLALHLQNIYTPFIFDQQLKIPALIIQNTGINTFTGFHLEITDASGQTVMTQDSTFNFVTNQKISLPEKSIAWSAADATLKFSLSPLSGTDEDPSNNSLQLTYKTPTHQLISPFRTNTKALEQQGWYRFSGSGADDWITEDTLQYNFREVAKDQSISLFTTPMLDLSDFSQAGLALKVAYNLPYAYHDSLEIWAFSPDRTIRLARFGGADLETDSSNAQLVSPQLFKEIFNSLDVLAGEKQVAIGLHPVSGGGNRLFIQSLELFANDTRPPLLQPQQQWVVYPNPANELINLQIQLPNTTSGTLWITNSRGEKIWTSGPKELLNQWYTVPVQNWNEGLYLFFWQMGNKSGGSKFLIRH